MSDTDRPPIARVRVILPSSPAKNVGDLEAGYAWLRAVGLQVEPAPVLESSALLFLAGDDPHRAQAYLDAWHDFDADAVWCGRGGSGAIRTLEALDLLPGGPPGNRQRPLVGLSDATALLVARARHRRGLAIHGPVITQLPRLDGPSREALIGWLRAPESLPELRCSNHEAIVPGSAQGDLVVGNLSMFASCAGTPEAVDCRDALLLIEDVAEPAYRIDRMMSQLQRSGAFAGIAGLAFGTFVDCHPAEEVVACLADWARRLSVPCCGTFPVGHGEACFPLALGLRYRLCADRGLLTPCETVTDWLSRTRPEAASAVHVEARGRHD